MKETRVLKSVVAMRFSREELRLAMRALKADAKRTTDALNMLSDTSVMENPAADALSRRILAQETLMHRFEEELQVFDVPR